MAFVKLFPPDGRAALAVADVVRRLGDEFAVVDADTDAGRDHVGDVIAATLRFSDTVPDRGAQLAWLLSVRNAAVYVSFGDAPGLVAACCVMPDSELFFGLPDEVDGPARPLVERAASALGYVVYEG